MKRSGLNSRNTGESTQRRNSNPRRISPYPLTLTALHRRSLGPVHHATAVAISNIYYEDNRAAYDAVSSPGLQIGVDMATNIMKELWPDFDHKLRRKHSDEADAAGHRYDGSLRENKSWLLFRSFSARFVESSAASRSTGLWFSAAIRNSQFSSGKQRLPMPAAHDTIVEKHTRRFTLAAGLKRLVPPRARTPRCLAPDKT